MASLASLPLDSVSLSAPPSGRISWIATSARPTSVPASLLVSRPGSRVRMINRKTRWDIYSKCRTGLAASLDTLKSLKESALQVVVQVTQKGAFHGHLSGRPMMVLTTCEISSGPNSTSWLCTSATSQSWSSCTTRHVMKLMTRVQLWKKLAGSVARLTAYVGCLPVGSHDQ